MCHIRYGNVGCEAESLTESKLIFVLQARGNVMRLLPVQLAEIFDLVGLLSLIFTQIFNYVQEDLIFVTSFI